MAVMAGGKLDWIWDQVRNRGMRLTTLILVARPAMAGDMFWSCKKGQVDMMVDV